MTTNNTGKGLALVAGFVATAGALAILLQDAIRTGNWTLEHGLIPVLMTVQILTAHLFTTAARQWRILPALGFAIVATVATWGVLYTSIGKQTATAADATLVAQDVNERRAAITKRITENQNNLTDALAEVKRLCKGGNGKDCRGSKATVQVYTEALAGTTAALEAIGPAKAVDAKADKVATVLAALTGSDRDHLKEVLTLTEPFTLALVFELTALVSFGYGFGHRKPSTVSTPSPQDTAQTSFFIGPANDTGNPGNGPTPPGNGPRGPGNGRRVFTKDAASADIVQLVTRNRQIPQQQELADRWGVGKGTASKWLSDFEAQGLIKRATVGRQKTVSAA